MQTWITDFSFIQSAKNLDRKRLQANIYESIQILASLLDCSDKLVNPKRNVKNYPQAKLWKDYELGLWVYIYFHIIEWMNRGYKYKDTITEKNIIVIIKYLYRFNNNNLAYNNGIPNWITDELIQVHRSILIQKSDYYKKLWPDVPDNLKMRYNWRVIMVYSYLNCGEEIICPICRENIKIIR
jgi:hypothetical protein